MTVEEPSEGISTATASNQRARGPRQASREPASTSLQPHNPQQSSSQQPDFDAQFRADVADLLAMQSSTNLLAGDDSLLEQILQARSTHAAAWCS